MSFTLKCNKCGNENELISYWGITEPHYPFRVMEEHENKVYVDYGDREMVCLKCERTEDK